MPADLSVLWAMTELQSAIATTDSNGEFQLKGVCLQAGGEVNVKAVKPGYAEGVKAVSSSAGVVDLGIERSK